MISDKHFWIRDKRRTEREGKKWDKEVELQTVKRMWPLQLYVSRDTYYHLPFVLIDPSILVSFASVSKVYSPFYYYIFIFINYRKKLFNLLRSEWIVIISSVYFFFKWPGYLVEIHNLNGEGNGQKLFINFTSLLITRVNYTCHLQ